MSDAAGLRVLPRPSPLHSGIRVGTFLTLLILATLFPLAAGFVIFGWRAVGTTATVVGSALGAMAILQQVGWHGRQVRMWHCLWLAIMVSLMLPAHLFTTAPVNGRIVWPILPAAGITLALLSWLLGGLGTQRIPPSVVTILLLFVMFHQLLTPRYILRPDRLFTGDLLDAEPAAAIPQRSPWIDRTPSSGFDALRADPAGDDLLAYTSAQQRPERASVTMQMLIRDQMPPLENLIIAGQSAAIGNASALAIIAGGLFLLYQGLIDFRIPLLGTLAAMAGLLILPVPVYITDLGAQWHWLAFRGHYLGWATAMTFVNYEIFASPLLLTLFYLAPTPGLRPITRRGRAIFAIGLGLLSAVFQLYATVSMGPYIALLIIVLLTPTLDRLIKPRTLV
ncbi:MAG TPA: RnfABCDGE type electron transport complex subunit D [Tepidisphaeraceae bacterium]|jgi:electron transport complex protein RnfD|nr:RnfABCDGE type electron transport complex subunit D [Tepidisphaeraceae bacterium]